MTADDFRTMRIKADLTQRELASYMGVVDKTISRWENGETEIPKIAQMLMKLIASGLMP